MNIIPATQTKTVLCTIDFSTSTPHSIAWGLTLARQLNAHLTILYTYRLVQSRAGEIILLKKSIEDEAKQKFIELEKAHLIGTGISYDFQIEVGFVSDRIEDHSKKTRLNIVVMDKPDRSNSNETLEELMEHIDVPILLIP